MSKETSLKILFALKDAQGSANKAAKGLTDNSNTLSKSLKIGNAAAYLGVLKRIASGLSGCAKASADYVENLNLLDVAFGKSSQSAQNFIDKVSGVFGLDESALTRQLGLFRQIGNSLNIDSENADKLAKNLTKMQLDMSSLYNIDFSKAGTILQSALAGQTKSIRGATGADITEATLQTDLLNLGINKSVKELSRASKVVLIYHSLTRQLATAQGDLAKTINSPANQMRIFTEQCSRLARAIGNVLLPTVGAILPYFNAFLMVLVKIVNTLAKFLGFDAKSLAGVTGGIGNVETGFEDAAGAADDLSNAAKEAQKSLRGFDKLNVITTPKTSGGGSGGAGVGGVDPDLLAALEDYDLKIDKIKNKATELAEQFEKWLKVLAPLKEPLEKIANLTFEGLHTVWEEVLKPLGKWVGWKLIPEIAKTLASALDLVYKVLLDMKPILEFIYKNIIEPFAKVIGNTIISILNDLRNLFDSLSKSKFFTQAAALVTTLTLLSKTGGVLVTLFGKTKLGGALIAIGSALMQSTINAKNLNAAFGLLAGEVGPKLTKISTGVNGLQKSLIAVKNAASTLKSALAAALEIYVGIKIASSAVNDMAKNGVTIGNALAAAVGLVAVAIGGYTIGVTGATIATTAFSVAINSIPLVGIVTAITAVIAALGLLVAKFISSKAEAEQSKDAVAQYKEELKKLDEQARETAATNLASIESAERYKNKLLELFDANGNLIGSYEEANKWVNLLNDTLGTNYVITDGKLTQDGKVIKTNEDIEASIKRVIIQKKAEILLDAYREEYTKALKQNRDAMIELEKTHSNYEKVKHTYYSSEEEKLAAIEKAKAKVDKADKVYRDTVKLNHKTIKDYDDLLEASAEGNVEKITKASKKYIGETGDSADKVLKKTKEIKNDVSYLNGKSCKVTITGDTTALRSSVDNVFKNRKYELSVSGKSAGQLSINPVYRAKGGFPTEGELFIAREAGPELVGTMGNKNAVANNDQITEGIRRAARDGFLDAMMATDGNKVDVNIIAEGDTSGLLNFINFKQKQSDRQYGF